MDEKYHLALKTAFASEYAFALKAQNFHWNTEGPLFYQQHLLFERISMEADPTYKHTLFSKNISASNPHPFRIIKSILLDKNERLSE